MNNSYETKILYILGPKNSGKTTSLENIIKKINELGISTGSIKFTHKPVISELPIKDTARVRKAGSEFSIFLTPIETTISLKRDQRDDIGDVAHYLNKLLPPVDLIICESLNNPPKNSKIILTASNVDELEEYSNKIVNRNIIAITGKIAISDLKNWKNLPILNSLIETELLDLCNIIKHNFLLN